MQTGTPPLIHSATDNGFPSDHTLLLATAAVIVALVNRWAGAVGLVFALLIGLARVYVGVHHLLDIFGSFVIVAIAALIYLVGRGIWQRYSWAAQASRYAEIAGLRRACRERRTRIGVDGSPAKVRSPSRPFTT